MKNYIFADCPFNITFEDGRNNYDDFCSAESQHANQTITVCDFETVGAATYGVEYVSEPFEHFFRAQDNPTSMMFANSDWSQVKICRGKNGEYGEALMITAVYSHLCTMNTLFLHASYVDYKGDGIVFVGPSGIGKTTQAQLWEKHLGAQIVNGDKAFVRIIDNEVYAYGSPWCGSSPYCLNMKSPLSGIVVLKQSDKNCIRKLDTTEAMQYFMPHIFMPNWDKTCTNQVLTTFDKVLEKIPVWLLECRPDEEAVTITKNAILKDK